MSNSVENRIMNNPSISADQNLPELTFKAIVLGIILAIILAAANAYLGLKAGATVSASIPAAIISMGVLRWFRHSNILENNIVQTAASAGEALVAGTAFIIPALLILGYWQEFHYLDCVLLGIAGGGIGVIYSIPIRRVMLSNRKLPFPEGLAIGNVLKASADRSLGMKYIVQGGLVGAVVGFAQDGLQVVSEALTKWVSIGNNVLGYGLGFSPALLAAGYIVGFEVAFSIFVGTVLGWFLGVDVLAHFYNHAGLSAEDFVSQIGRIQLRYIGLGTMLLGGLVTMVNLIKPMVCGLRDMIYDKKMLGANAYSEIPRTERDLSLRHSLFGFIPFVLIAFFVLRYQVLNSFHLPAWHASLIVLLLLVFVLVAGFVFSCLCAYFSGLVGATNNPGSAMVLASVILCSFLMIIALGATLGVSGANLAAASLVIIASTMISNSALLTCETIQDLKAGQIVGATPWKQQLMLVLGVLVSAFVVPAVLQLLFQAYGMGGVYPHPGMNPAQSLSAPQSAMMATVVKAVFAHDLPWNLLFVGFFIAAICILLNFIFRARNWNLMVMAVGLGIYIPLAASTPMVLGGFAALLVRRHTKKIMKTGTPEEQAELPLRAQKALMLACGMVAGCALMGVILAVPFALSQSTSVLAIVSEKFIPVANIFGLLITAAILFWMYYIAARSKK